MKLARKVLLVLAAALAAAAGYYFAAGHVGLWPFTTTPALPADQRPATWAQPIQKPGLPNLHRISEGLYRGAQPDEQGMRELKAMGVRTIVNLRSEHSDAEKLTGLEMQYVAIPMRADKPQDADVAAFLRVAADTARGPVFVHCQHGADRTGTMCAAYRIVVQGWSKEEAIAEMTQGGFGFHAIWDELVEYIRNMDVAAVKAQAGLR